MDLDARQQALLTKHSFIVQAPAGSGKTELLTQRFLALLAHVQEPEEILALTFTRKAAQEMAHRILQALHDAKRQIPIKNEHQKATRLLAEKALAQSEKGNWQILEHPQRLRIKTFDGFCLEIYQSIPKEELATLPYLQIDPEPIYQKAVHQWFQFCRKHENYHEALKILIRQENNHLKGLFKKLCQSLYTRDQWLPGISIQNDLSPEEHQAQLAKLADYHWKNFTQTLPATIEKQLFDLIEQYHDYVPDGFIEIKGLRSLHELDSASLKALRTLLLTGNDSLRKSFDHYVGVKQKKPTDPRYAILKEASQAFLSILNEYPEFITQLLNVSGMPHPDDIELDWEILQAYYQLLPILVACLHMEFEEQESMDYTYVANQALYALKTTDISLYFDEKLHHLLIDEFQDTSSLQLQLIEQLTENWAHEPHKSLFLVGDPMQSIYRFRSAQVGIFLRAQQQGISGIQLKPLFLCQNFRSNANLIEYFNASFSNIFPKEEKIELGGVKFHAAHPTQVANKDCFVKAHFYENHQQQSQAILEIIQEALLQTDIRLAILVRSRSKLPEILHILKKNQIAYTGVDLFPLGERLYIRDLWNLTQLFLYPGQRVHELAVLGSPLCGLTLTELENIASIDPQGSLFANLQQHPELINARLAFFIEIYQKAWMEREQLPLFTLIENMACDLSFFKTLEDFEKKEVFLFFEILEQACERQVIPNTQDIQEKLSNTFVSSFNGLQIQVMTIHKSKGLEFDWVILPDMGAKPKNPDKTLLNLYNNPLTGLSFVLPEQKHPNLKILDAFNQQQTAYEAQRLCYVAFTRAKKRLYCLDAQKRPHKNSFRSLFPEQAFQAGDLTQSSSINTPEKQTFLQRIPENFYIQRLQSQENYQRPGEAFENHLWEKQMGTAAHRILQWICEFHPKNLDEIPWHLAERLFKHQGFSKHSCQKALSQIKQWILASLQHPTGQWICQAHTFEKTEFELLFKDSHIVRHMIIDRFFIEQEKLWIIDFKTKNFKKEYRTQLERYAKALKSLYPQYNIHCGLFFIATQEFTPWEMLIESQIN